jgi:hypothetical protein
MRSGRRATIADPTGSTAALESNYTDSAAPEFPAPTALVDRRQEAQRQPFSVAGLASTSSTLALIVPLLELVFVSAFTGRSTNAEVRDEV